MTYEETIAYLYASQPAFHQVGAAAYKPGFANTLALMQALGEPHKRLRAIHVAGTNGKGSTSHLMAACLQEAGCRVGLYTSPHLVDFRERIRVDGQMVEEEWVVHFVEEHKELLERIRPSFFETTMAMAFAYFTEQGIDYAVVEVGLGGRLDSTNILMPILSVITNIGMDHTEFLGTTLPAIAGEKAGIIKPNTPVVIGEHSFLTDSVFIAKARQENAPLLFAEDETKVPDMECELKGDYQQRNKQTAYCALMELRKLGIALPDSAIEKGYQAVCTLTGLRGRWEELRLNEEARERLGKHKLTIVCDTGHNAHGIRYVGEQLKKEQEVGRRTLRMVFGMVADKDIDDALQLLPKDAIYYATEPHSHRALSAEEMQKRLLAVGKQAILCKKAQEAVEKALEDAQEGDFVFIGGSNYLVGEVLKMPIFLRK